MASLSNDAEVMVLELGMGQKGVVISDMTKILKPTISALTSLGLGHVNTFIENDGEEESSEEQMLEKVFDAKMGIFNMEENSVAVLSSSIPIFDKAIEQLKERTLAIFTVGERQEDDMCIVSRAWSGDKNNISVIFEKEELSFSLDVPGKPVADNAAMALLLAEKLGVPRAKAIESLDGFKTRPGRSRVIDLKTAEGYLVRVFDDARNSTPLSLKEAFNTFCDISQDREKIAVLGEVGDFHVGGNSEKFHEDLGREIEEYNFSKVLLMGGGMEAVRKINPETFIYFEDPDGMVKFLIENITSDTSVMVKASAHMKFNYVVKKIRECLLK